MTAASSREVAARDADVSAWLGRRTSPHAFVAAADRSAPLLASFAQRRIWFDHSVREQLAGEGAAYHSVLPLRLRGALDVAALHGALAALIARHEVLRTTFVAREGELFQTIGPPYAPEVAVEAVGSDALTARMEAFFRAPFDLERGPVLRARLFRVEPAEHVLLLVVHHIATDGWSMDVIFRELGELYGAQRAGRAPELAELAVQFADVAAWERARFARGEFGDNLAFWREHLAGAPHVLGLPLDNARPAVQSFRGDWISFELPAPAAAAVERLARACEASSFQVLLAAFYVLLARWSGQRDLIVGVPVANRTLPETEALVGLFINVLPLRGRVDEAESFAALVRRTRATTLDAYDRQEISFDRLVEELAPERTLAHNPLVQVTLALVDDTGSPARADGAPFERLGFRNARHSHYDLTVAVTPGASGFTLDVNYAADLFERRTIERLGRRFVALLKAVTERCDVPLARVPATTLEEDQELTHFATGDPARDVVPVLAAFEQQVARAPHGVAVIEGPKRLTYAELDREADRIAALLAARGVTAGSAVGVCLPRSTALIAAMLGVWRARAVYLPLDPAYPVERLAYLVRDAAAPLVLADTETARYLDEAIAADVVDLASSGAAPATAPRAAMPSAGELACLIYTSGSTGHPKGVELTHDGLANFFAWFVQRFALVPADRCLQLASPSFDANLLDTLPALVSGASLVIGSDDWRVDPGRLWANLAEAGVTTALLTTPLFAAAAQAGAAFAQPHPRAIQIGGDRLAAVPDELPFELDNLYGPTETTITVTCGRQLPGQPVDIGTPIHGMRVRVLDAWLRPVPAGATGEIYVCGPGVARGYRGLRALTAVKFVPDPWAGDGSRMYRTGDHARWTAGGKLEFLGRVDAQVKIRGHRIEPGEVEAFLAGHPGVAEAVVTVRTDRPGEPRLCAYVRLHAGTSVDELRRFVADGLPNWMYPASYTVVERFPLTINDKIHRAALPAPDSGAERAIDAPSGPVEELVAQIWRDVLGVERIGSSDNFFRLGGHSLLATRIASRLTAAVGCSVPIRTVFDRPVLADFARAVEDAIVVAASEQSSLDTRSSR